VSANEYDDFFLESNTFTMSKSHTYDSFEFEVSEDKLRVYFSYSYYQHGAPDRKMYRRNIFNLSRGETASFHINGRFTSYTGQSYKQYFVNIGYDVNEATVFLTKPFNQHIDKMANLF